MTDEARAIRIGARLTDLTIALQAGDTVAPQIAAGVVALLDPIPASAPASSIFHAIANPNATKRDREHLLSQGTAAATALAGRRSVSLGAWLEAARIASSRHDAAFFKSTTSQAMMASEPTLRRIHVGSDSNWVSVGNALSTALGTLGS